MQDERRRDRERHLRRYAQLQRACLHASPILMATRSPAGVPDAFERILEELGRTTGVDRAYIVRFDLPTGDVSNITEWCKDGVESVAEPLTRLSLDGLPWWRDTMLRDRIVCVGSPSELPPEAKRELFEDQPVSSRAFVALLRSDRIIELIGLDTVHRRITWGELEKDVLRTLSSIVATALDRIDVTATLDERERRYRQLFENMSSGFALHRMILDAGGDAVDYEFLEVNDAFCQMTGLSRSEVVGRRITAVLTGTGIDPEDWINRYARVAGGHGAIRFEEHSHVLGRSHEVVAYSPISGNFATIFHDITEQFRAHEMFRHSFRRIRR